MRQVIFPQVCPPRHELFIAAGDESDGSGPPANYVVASIETGHLVTIPFQHGNPDDEGVNGVTNEALIAIVIHRLEEFQAGPFPCDENAIALGDLHAALDNLNGRSLRLADEA